MPRTRTKQPELPGVERKINELQAKAMEYAAIRDERMEFTEQESNLKEQLLELMKKYGLEKYKFENVSVEIVHETEKVKVRVRKEGDSEDENE